MAVPNVVGLTVVAATAALAAAGYQTAPQVQNSSSVAAGLCISQNPASGTASPAGTSVIITMSAGPTPVAGMGGDVWGAHGGGQAAVNAEPPLGQNLANGSAPDNAVYLPPSKSVLSSLGDGNINLSQATPAYQVPTSPRVG